MTDASDFQHTVKESVLEGKPLLPENNFVITQGQSNPYAVRSASLKSLTRRLDGDGPEVEAVVVGDAGDADGGSSTAVLRHKYGGKLPKEIIDMEAEYPFKPLFDDSLSGGIISLPASHRGYYPNPVDTMSKAMDTLEKHGRTDIPVYVVDLGANEEDADAWIEQFNRENDVLVRDHHTKVDRVVEAADEYVHDPDKCATEIVLETDYPDAPSHLHELAQEVRILDLWLDDHPEFQEKQILSDAHFILGDAVFERLAAHYGAGIVTSVPGISEELQLKRKEKEAKIQYAVENAEFQDFDINGETITIASSAGDFYYSEAGRRLYTDHGADIVVMAKPSGSVSIRTSDEYPVADKIASRINGGGHPKAAGFDTTADDDADLETKRRIAVVDVVRALRQLLRGQAPELASGLPF